MFVTDYLSWDEDEPDRRAEVLQRYLPPDVDPTYGWSGLGRQCVEIVCPGRIQPDGDRLWVDVKARVLIYEPTNWLLEPASDSDDAEDEQDEQNEQDESPEPATGARERPGGRPRTASSTAPDQTSGAPSDPAPSEDREWPSSAPPPAASGWHPARSVWICLQVPIRSEQHGLVVDPPRDSRTQPEGREE